MTYTQQNYLLDISYNGSSFHGFQSQTNKNSIQDKLEAALTTYLRHPVKIRGASRTDSGVHAFGQKAVFSTDRALDTRKFLLGINALVPREIAIKAVKDVPLDFNPIYESKAKIYRYTLWRDRCFNPFLAPFLWNVNPAVDFSALEKSFKEFCGSHDFSSFCSIDSSAKTKVREVLDIKLIAYGDSCDIWFLGKGFLKQMIRIMVGTAVELNLGKLKAQNITDIIAAKDRTQAGRTAPGQGLFLMEVFFTDPPKLSEYIDSFKEKGFFYH